MIDLLRNFLQRILYPALSESFTEWVRRIFHPREGQEEGTRTQRQHAWREVLAFFSLVVATVIGLLLQPIISVLVERFQHSPLFSTFRDFLVISLGVLIVVIVALVEIRLVITIFSGLFGGIFGPRRPRAAPPRRPVDEPPQFRPSDPNWHPLRSDPVIRADPRHVQDTMAKRRGGHVATFLFSLVLLLGVIVAYVIWVGGNIPGLTPAPLFSSP